MKIVAIVVGLNEAFFLDKCLSNLFWCDEVLYFDLGSTDNSVEIASNKKNVVVRIVEPLPYVELVHQKYCNDVDADLIVLTDPDEIINDSLLLDLRNNITKFDLKNNSEIRVNMNYYFKGKRLNGTYWGGVYSSRFIYNNRVVSFSGLVHDGVQTNLSKPLEVEWNTSSFVEHHWSRNWSHLFEKHLRYLKSEGKSMHSRGLNYSTYLHIFETIKAFWFSFRMKKGYKDGFTGLLLSLFWAWYTFKRWSSLKKYQRIE